MKYNVECEVHIGDNYEVEADSEQEASDIAYDIFIKDYGLKNNPTILGFSIIKNIEEVNE